MKRIHDSLKDLFQRHRLIFWYDGNMEWEKAFESFEDTGIEKLRIANNEFGIKVKILKDADPDDRFLIYSSAPRPADNENWLLDLVLQGHEFQADRASLAVQEVGISYDFRDLAERHVAFFRKAENVRKLKEWVTKEDEAEDLRLKMMAILAGTAVELDGMLLKFLDTAVAEPLLDPAPETLGEADLLEPFWREVGRTFGYTSTEPSIRDFVVTLFRGEDPLDGQTQLHAHAKVFLQRWKDSKTHRESFRQWSGIMERELQVESRLDTLEDPARIGGADAFESFDKYTIHRGCAAFQKEANPAELNALLNTRRQSFWYEAHRHGYEALEQAVELRELIKNAELNIDSIDTGLSRYVTSWWRIDMAYRSFCWHHRKYGQVNVMERVAEWVEKSYVNNFLLPLGDQWSDQVSTLKEWKSDRLPDQSSFFESCVKPFTQKGQKVFVVISDALRFEAAADFANQILAENRWTTKVEACLASLPSYTQLGMASLLPGKILSVSPEDATVSVDGKSSIGTDNRRELLKQATEGKATAIQAEQFLELNTKTEGRALMREHEVIYVFHNVIDKIGDNSGTEAKTTDAVEQCFDELVQILKKVANVNGNNMILTADHGFLFQQGEIHQGDAMPLPNAEEWLNRNRRFAIGKGIKESPAVKVFEAAQLGLDGDWSVAFPKSLGRFPLQGSGKRYVHGGFSLQEVVVPIVRIHKARSDDTRRVEVELMRVPAKVTTGRVSLAVYQDEPVSGKTLPRELKLGVHAKDGTVLSEVKTIEFASEDPEPRNRESSHVLVLSSTSDQYNDKTVEVRLEETLPGTKQTVTYKSHPIKIQKPFATDFDEF